MAMPNNTYGALFGSATQVPTMGGGQMGVQPAAISSAPIDTVPMAPPPMAPIAPPPQAQPLPLGVSDYRAKANVYKANKDLDALLQRVYNNLGKGKK